MLRTLVLFTLDAIMIRIEVVPIGWEHHEIMPTDIRAIQVGGGGGGIQKSGYSAAHSDRGVVVGDGPGVGVIVTPIAGVFVAV